ncbi:uncharacterized protein M437DRAFT_83962 [Aureobasidium melanogenum CBS 110374]|uniref:Uncharacterized protein n=1 Tax=Aureobasidium melanogenum (strain CBS 110374) TaxID=1043003 RepID=A0A074VWF8_AURM1|nr:uncharacterized protein M437DRAFT_83962 [Aureobasidium melanogenum CBS 110374]KEQ63589.1 hypothetical protein M437DRAFT_83962 [Aureobasidium melanogenum CBS 110374]
MSDWLPPAGLKKTSIEREKVYEEANARRVNSTILFIAIAAVATTTSAFHNPCYICIAASKSPSTTITQHPAAFTVFARATIFVTTTSTWSSTTHGFHVFNQFIYAGIRSIRFTALSTSIDTALSGRSHSTR